MKNDNIPQSVEDKVLKRIRGRGLGSVVVPGDFIDLGLRKTVDSALQRLTKNGDIRRVGRGVYFYSKPHPVLGDLEPPIEAVAKAIAGRDQTRLQPTGALAANLLGLSEQVPAKTVFLTDGPSKTVKVGTRTIQLRNTSVRQMAAAGKPIGLLIQALRYLGEEQITANHIALLKNKMSAEDRKGLLRDLKLAPAWMHSIIHQLAESNA